MKNNQSKALTKFYREYLEWGGKGSHPIFDDGYGLCQNLSNWVGQSPTSHYTRSELMRELILQFVAAELSPYLPFNNDENLSYWTELRKSSNRKRMAWVEEHAR